MNTQAAMEYMRTHPFFWSRLGFGFDPPLLDDQGNLTLFGEDAPFLEEHRRFTEAGCTIHTFILPSGRIGVDQYDYTVVDRLLEGIFCEGKAAYVIPRIKLNVPVDWCSRYPTEVLVYQQGPRNEDSIRTTA